MTTNPSKPANDASMRRGAHETFRTTCNGCSNGCKLIVWREDTGVEVAGNHCRKGIVVGKEAFLSQEQRPFRGKIKLTKRWLRLSVVTEAPLPREAAEALKKELAEVVIDPPITKGSVVYTSTTGIRLFAVRDIS